MRSERGSVVAISAVASSGAHRTRMPAFLGRRPVRVRAFGAAAQVHDRADVPCQQFADGVLIRGGERLCGAEEDPGAYPVTVGIGRQGGVAEVQQGHGDLTGDAERSVVCSSPPSAPGKGLHGETSRCLDALGATVRPCG